MYVKLFEQCLAHGKCYTEWLLALTIINKYRMLTVCHVNAMGAKKK